MASKKKVVLPSPRTWDGMNEDEQYQEALKLAAVFVEELCTDEVALKNPAARTA